MKKTYMTPTTTENVVAWDNEMLAGSFNFSDDGESGTVSFEDENAVGPALSRGRSIWDED
ncbi:MAG: hypothetical protein J6M25_08340 [Prevotella sp.]|nr:hypothetical protein [Prevotella sp.]